MRTIIVIIAIVAGWWLYSQPTINQARPPSESTAAIQGTPAYQPSALTRDQVAQRIPAHAVRPYTLDQYPRTFEQFGERIHDIDELRRQAAEIVIRSGKCNRIEIAELSMSKSSANDLRFWVDCTDGTRVQLSELEIKAQGSVLTQAEKAWSDEDALAACKKAIMDSTMIPTKTDIHTILGTRVRKAPTTHTVIVSMDFDATNAFGVEIPYTATCRYPPGEAGSIDIADRR